MKNRRTVIIGSTAIVKNRILLPNHFEEHTYLGGTGLTIALTFGALSKTDSTLISTVGL